MAAIDRSTNRENFDAVAELIDQNVSHFDPLAGLFLWDHFMYGMVWYLASLLNTITGKNL